MTGILMQSGYLEADTQVWGTPCKEEGREIGVLLLQAME